MSRESFQAFKRAEAYQPMAALRQARKNGRAARAFDRQHGLTNGAKGRITSPSQVMRATARWTETG